MAMLRKSKIKFMEEVELGIVDSQEPASNTKGSDYDSKSDNKVYRRSLYDGETDSDQKAVDEQSTGEESSPLTSLVLF